MTSYNTYKVTYQKYNSLIANMLIFVFEGNIIGQQDNAQNTLTQTWADDDEDWGEFNPNDYLKCRLV